MRARTALLGISAALRRVRVLFGAIAALIFISFAVAHVTVGGFRQTLPMPANLDYSDLVLAWAIYLAIPFGILGGQILIFERIGQWTRNGPERSPARAIRSLIGIGVAALITVGFLTHDGPVWDSGPLSTGWPLFYVWAALWAGLALTALAAVLALIGPQTPRRA